MRTPLFGLFGLQTAFASSARAWPAKPSTSTGPLSITWKAACGTELTLRPVRSSDAALLGELFEDGLSRAARYSRFHGAMGRLSAARLAWMADADFKRHAAFIITRCEDGLEHAVAEGRWVCTAVAPGAEFALSVADAWQGQGLGRKLLAALVQAGRACGLSVLNGDVLPGNLAMQAVARSQHFGCTEHPEEAGLMRAALSLSAASAARSRAERFAAAWLH